MNSKRGTRHADSRTRTLQCIADGRRRAALRILLDAEERLPVREVASRLADAERGVPDAAAAETGLVHVHLPALSDAGLVEWDRDDECVETATHPVLDDPRFRELLETDGDGADEALSALSDERRRLALAVLRDDGTTVSRSALAGEVLRREAGDADTNPDADDVRRVEFRLHHVHLPKLDDADFVAYDPERGRVSYADHPALETVFAAVHEAGVDPADGFDDLSAECGLSRR
ncbi:DUF7344 domain-containing protein [Halopelagius longus]|uniref:DUF7344 domain-containing protein n=1 Tax=Halopelagius longus TaxID=1236180 RepID=A0A1H0Y0U9_9EURY|nr:hypothetical protein [Halopelagius longus]RDI72213.1 hypothetical protein DWB78_11105 [Halopelagius longus]SDQ08774.1 hypothetical protein SAMN05216278_0329 [Halopelagius longus]